MGDGGFRPAFNLQFAPPPTRPASSQIEARTGALPAELLLDGGYTQALI